MFTYDVVIQCSSQITIGDHCMFGQASLVVDGNHNFRDLELPMLHQGYTLTPITLADHVTTTTKCTIIADIGHPHLRRRQLGRQPTAARLLRGGRFPPPARSSTSARPVRSPTS